jgi:hypothetical protein
MLKIYASYHADRMHFDKFSCMAKFIKHRARAVNGTKDPVSEGFQIICSGQGLTNCQLFAGKSSWPAL